jgi:hypothetical protein
MAMSALEKRFTNDVGSPDQVRKELLRFSKNVNLLAARRQELTRLYPNKWVAFYDGDIISIGNDLSDLLIEIDAKGLKRDAVITQYLSTEKMTMIL